MQSIRWLLACITALFLAMNLFAEDTMASFMTPDELQLKSQWVSAHLTDAALKADALPFSFRYDGKASADLLATWPHTRETIALDKTRTQRTERWADPKTGLEIRCVSVEYADYPAIEWTVYFKNTGKENTPILENLQGIDTVLQKNADGEFILNGIKGDSCTADSYEPYQLKLGANTTKTFAPANSGKSSDGPAGWPYYNLQMPGSGVLVAIGWPGQWQSSFERDQANGVRIRAGQARTYLSLKPGEEIRTPLIALLFWLGTDMERAQNLWRRWYIAYNMPRVDGQTQQAVAQIQIGGGETDIAYVQSFLDAGIHVDLCWRDAGGDAASIWFPTAGGPYPQTGMAWLNSGTWDIDPAKYPKGFKPFTDWIHARGMQFVLWFEPERVGNPNSWLGKQHPEWLLPGTSHGALLDEGNPAARQWLIKHVDDMIKTQGIDWYREDMNGSGPLPAWRKNDAPDRQGMTENLYVQGHLAFWDELRRRHPGLRIDSCASGGRRNDLETMRRAVPLLRSDFQMPGQKNVIEGNQGHTYGLSSWLPFQGTGTYSYDAYAYRSFYLPSFGMGGMTPENRAAQQKAYAECRKVAPLMLGDYYPLTPYNLQLDQWIAWQFNRSEQGDGVVQAFRRPKCDTATQVLRLRGLDPAAQYEVTNFDLEGTVRTSGKELMEMGLAIEIKDKPGAAVIVYKQLNRSVNAKEPAGADITASAFGDIYDTSDGGKPMGKGGGFATLPSGDTWYTAWAKDDTLYANVDDGLGFEDPGGKHTMLRNCLCMLTGNPNESTDGFRGVNLNPGSRGATIPNSKNVGAHGYTSSLYELDGILYQIRHAWSPTRELWPPIDSCIIKSSDGGRNWVNHLGKTNVALANGANAMFSALPWSWMTFVQYGKGGSASAVDRADEYAYLTAAGEYLVRVPRQKLPDLNKADFQYYRGASRDGMLDASWSSVPADAGKINETAGQNSLNTITYNFGLKRYIATACVYYFAPGEGFHDTGKARFIILSAAHPWGPWKPVTNHALWGRAGWNMLMANKFASNDGLKMWYNFCGEYKGDLWYYGFQYMPLYMSTGAVDLYEAETAKLTGVQTANIYPGASGTGYIQNFTKPGDRAVFDLNNVNGTGWHIVRIHYTSPKTNGGGMSIYVNGRKVKRVTFSLNNSDYKPEMNWTDRSDIYFLKNGTNTFEIRQDPGDSGVGLMIDYLAVSREMTFDEGINIAPEATATASSGEAGNAINGCAGDGANEWSTTGTEGEWIKLTWDAPRSIERVKLYDKINKRDQVTSGTLSFSDGSDLPVGLLQNDGQAGTVITFPPKTVTWVKLTITKVRAGTVNAGLGHFEVYTAK